MFQQVLKDAILAAHPIGSIYESTESTSPEVLFGGTWEAMEAGRVLVSSGTATTGTVYNAGSTGGEEAHTLTNYELPARTVMMLQCSADVNAFDINEPKNETVKSGGWTHTNLLDAKIYGIISDDINQPHNNMQPYEAIYRWKRTA